MSLVAPGYENYLELGDTFHCLRSIFFLSLLNLLCFGFVAWRHVKWFCGLEAREMVSSPTRD